MTSSSRLALACLPLLAAAPPLTSQRPVTAYDVYQACGHPAAFPADSFALRDSIRVRSGLAIGTVQGDGPLQALCAVGLRGRSAQWERRAASLARQAAGGGFPSAGRIRHFVDGVDDALARWDAEAPPSLRRRQGSLPLPIIPFETSSAEVTAADSAIVRRIAEALRDHFEHYPADEVTIVGRADHRGSDSINEALALRRAHSVWAALMRHGGGMLAPYQRQIRTMTQLSDSTVTTSTIRHETQALGQQGPIAMRGASVAELARERAPEFLATGPLGGARRVSLHSEAPLLSAAPAGASAAGGRGSIAVALVDVVSEVAAEQVQMFLVEEVTGKICRPFRASEGKRIDGQRLLPGTCALFGRGAEHGAVRGGDRARVRPEPLFRPTLASLRQAVRQDVHALLPKLVGEAVHAQFGETAQHHTEALFAVALAQYLVEVAGGGDVLGAVATLPARLPFVLPAGAWEQVRSQEMGEVIQQAGPFLDLYREARSRIREGADPQAVKEQIFALSLRATLVNAGDPTVAGEVWGDNRADDLARLLRSVPAILEAAGGVEESFAAYREARGATAEERLSLASDLIDSSASLFVAIVPSDSGPLAARLGALAAPVSDMTTSLVRRDYREALVNALIVAQNIVPPSDPSCRTMTGLYCADSAGLSHDVLRVANFASEFVNAADQAGMNRSLRRFVSGGDGFRAKRSDAGIRNYFSVNAYLGLAGAREFGGERGTRDHTQGAVYLPVGIELGRRWPEFGSLSLFFQMVDLGAVAAARLGSDDVEQPAPELMDFVSPGLFVVKTIAPGPVSIGVGLSAAPRAQIVDDGDEERVTGAFRASLFLAVDVPLFP